MQALYLELLILLIYLPINLKKNSPNIKLIILYSSLVIKDVLNVSIFSIDNIDFKAFNALALLSSKSVNFLIYLTANSGE